MTRQHSDTGYALRWECDECGGGRAELKEEET